MAYSLPVPMGRHDEQGQCRTKSLREWGLLRPFMLILIDTVARDERSRYRVPRFQHHLHNYPVNITTVNETPDHQVKETSTV